MSAGTLPRVTPGQSGHVGPIEYVVFGEGEPVTVFAHGLAGSVSEIKPLAMPLDGTRVLFHFRGHGKSAPLTNGWDYDLFADDLLTIADAFDATGACGLSLGAGTLLRVLANDPTRFDRLAFVMPAALDEQRNDGSLDRFKKVGAGIAASDAGALKEILMAEIPADIRENRVTQILMARRAAEMAAMEPPAPSRPDLPIAHTSELAAVTAPAVVVAQQGDLVHSVSVADRLAAALPNSTLTTLEPGGVFWTQPHITRAVLQQHFNGPN